MKEFGVGRVLGTGFKVWARNIVPFTLIAVVLYSPAILWGASLASDPLGNLETLKSWDVYLALMSFAFNVAVTAALTYGVVMELQGTHASIGACMSVGFSRLFPVLGVVLLSSLAIMGGFIALIIPGIIISLMLYVATPVAVIEKPGVVASLSRSRQLTSGHKADIFIIVFVLGAMAWVVKLIEKEVLVPSEPAAALRALPMLLYVDLATQVVFGALGAVMAAVAYYYLRLQKEGTSVQELAKVFE